MPLCMHRTSRRWQGINLAPSEWEMRTAINANTHTQHTPAGGFSSRASPRGNIPWPLRFLDRYICVAQLSESVHLALLCVRVCCVYFSLRNRRCALARQGESAGSAPSLIKINRELVRRAFQLGRVCRRHRSLPFRPTCVHIHSSGKARLCSFPHIHSRCPRGCGWFCKEI